MNPHDWAKAAQEQETFWTLLRNLPHWEFELFLMLLFDVVLGLLIWPWFRKWVLHHSSDDEKLASPAYSPLAKRVKAIMPLILEREQKTGRKVMLEVDGGVKADNIGAIAAAGADTFVAGSAIFGADDYAATITAMRKAVADATRA